MKPKLLGLVAALMLNCGLWAASLNIANAATISQVSTSVDQGAQTVGFEIVFNSMPDFLSVDGGGRPADQFRFYILNANVSFLNQCVECVFTNNSDPFLTENLGTINVSHGFQPSFATLSFSQNNNIVDFAASFSLLNTSNGNFSYLLVSYIFGSEQLRAFMGSSGGGAAQLVNPFSVLPLPAALPLFATGLGALGLLGWRRKRKAAALAA